MPLDFSHPELSQLTFCRKNGSGLYENSQCFRKNLQALQKIPEALQILTEGHGWFSPSVQTLLHVEMKKWLPSR